MVIYIFIYIFIAPGAERLWAKLPIELLRLTISLTTSSVAIIGSFWPRQPINQHEGKKREEEMREECVSQAEH